MTASKIGAKDKMEQVREICPTRESWPCKAERYKGTQHRMCNVHYYEYETQSRVSKITILPKGGEILQFLIFYVLFLF